MAGKRKPSPVEIVTLGLVTPTARVARYRGNSTVTSWPKATSALGSASITSARPPVLENGSPSDATNNIFMAKCETPNLLKPSPDVKDGWHQVAQTSVCGFLSDPLKLKIVLTLSETHRLKSAPLWIRCRMSA